MRAEIVEILNEIKLEPVTKKFYKDILKLRKVNITFKKKDGTERKMLATLKPDLIVSDKLDTLIESIKQTDPKPHKENEEVLVMFDLEKQAWRSCRLDSIISFEVI